MYKTIGNYRPLWMKTFSFLQKNVIFHFSTKVNFHKAYQQPEKCFAV